MQIKQIDTVRGTSYYRVSGQGANFEGTLSECKRYTAIYKAKILSREQQASDHRALMLSNDDQGNLWDNPENNTDYLD